jgi:curved DNA-binding protein CbpA
MDLIQVYLKYDLYETLELLNDATVNDIKKKYKKLAIKFHPDKYLNSNELSDDEKQTLQIHFNLINIAYDILSKDETRTLYDKARKEYLDAGQINDLKKQFNDFEFNYGDKNIATKTFIEEGEKRKMDNEKIAEEIRENTKKNLTKTYEVNRIENFDELMQASNKEVKKEYTNKFNNLFDSMRQKTNKHTEITAFNSTNESSLNDVFSLITNNSNTDYSSLDNAFNLLDVSEKDYVESKLSIDERMKAYQNDFNKLVLPTPKSKELPKFSDSYDFEKNRFN